MQKRSAEVAIEDMDVERHEGANDGDGKDADAIGAILKLLQVRGDRKTRFPETASDSGMFVCIHSRQFICHSNLRRFSTRSVIAVSAVAASASVCRLYLYICVSLHCLGFKNRALHASYSPYAPRPMFIATESSLTIISAETRRREKVSTTFGAGGLNIICREATSVRVTKKGGLTHCSLPLQRKRPRYGVDW